MLIRPANIEDAQIVYQFVCELEHISFDFPLFERIFLRNIHLPNYYYLVSEQKGKIVGFISCHAQNLLHHCGMVGEIQELFILNEYRNKGIGQALMLELERIAQNNGWVNLEVTCNKKRLATHSFYKQIGFAETHYKYVKTIG